MYKFWSFQKNHLSFRQLVIASGILLTSVCQGQTSPQPTAVNRTPASYIPDDDVIVKPVNNELSFYQQYVASDKSEEVAQSRNQLKVWNDNQQFANEYGLDSTMTGSAYFVPSADQKLAYFKDKYMRYLRQKGEQPVKDMQKNWYMEYRASNEVDTIDEMEGRFKSSNKKATASSHHNAPAAVGEKEVSIWKNNRFIFQPRVEQGLVIVGIKGPLAYARAWVGANGKTEFNVQKSIDSIGFRAMYNYDAETKKFFTSVDQRIMDNLYARYTNSKDPRNEINDKTLMLLYAKQF